jgi:hypothetical protein
VTHRDAIIDGYRVEFGCIASHALYFFLDDLSYLVQMSMTGHKLRERVHDSDNWFTKLLMFHTCGNPECSGSCHSSAFSAYGTSQLMFHILLFFVSPRPVLQQKTVFKSCVIPLGKGREKTSFFNFRAKVLSFYVNTNTFSFYFLK